MTLLRQEETMHILNNYQNFTPQYILNYFLKYRNDSDCIYIFDNLPEKLQKTIDDMAAEEVKVKDEMIEENDKKLKQLDVMIEAVTNFNKQITNDIHIQECQMETVRELNRQLGVIN